MTDSKNPSQWIFEADDQTFQQQVVERSRLIPVVVDFWAAWCQPCRLLGPTLERLACEFDGRFVLAKVEIEKAPSIAAAFNVQSIPAVYGIRDGELLDFFVGLLPESQIRSWLERLLPSAAELLVAQADELVLTDPQAAEVKYCEASTADPNLASAKIGLAASLLTQKHLEAAEAILGELESRGYLEPAAEKLKAQLHMAVQASRPIDLDQLRAGATDPKDLRAGIALAEGLAAAQCYQESLEVALNVVQVGNSEHTETARKLMIDLFRLLDNQPELVTEYRRKLSTALY